LIIYQSIMNEINNFVQSINYILIVNAF
jgi:hypothetical protein